MTTAHRPTWKAAVARASETTSGVSYSTQSVLDVSGHTKLKHRKTAPSESDKSKADIIQASLLKLKQAEDKLKSYNVPKRLLVQEVEDEGRRKLLKQTADVDEERLLLKYDDTDDKVQPNSGWSDVDNDSESDLDDSDSDSDDTDSDEDEEALLQAELARIRAEREDAKAKEEQAKMEQEASKMEGEALVGNPLLLNNQAASGKLKRRWNDDVVFRNQAKGQTQPTQKRFINDTVRNDFHKRFLNKFIR